MKRLSRLLRLPLDLFFFIFGRLNWRAPPWVNGLNAIRKQKPGIFWALPVVLIILFASYQYYLTLPQPITVTAKISAPGITPDSAAAKPDTLDIRFEYDLSNLKQSQSAPSGLPSVARIDLIGKTIEQGISLTPAKAGRWLWLSDRQIQFIPETDWPAGTEYSIEFNTRLFTPETRLSKTQYGFSTPTFNTTISSLEFYQDPLDLTVRRVISTLKFSHPIEKSSLEKHLKLAMRPSGASIDEPAKSYSFEVSYGKNLREAYIQTLPIELPKQNSYMTLSVEPGVSSLLGGEPGNRSVEEQLLIPDIYSFLKVRSPKIEIVKNDQQEPEQILMLEFTDQIAQQEISEKLSVYLLPKKGQPQGKSYWSNPAEVNVDVLKHAKKIPLELISNKREISKTYNFRIDTPEDHFLYLRIEPGLTSINQFVYRSFFDKILRVPDYPKEVEIAGEGSILTYSGEHKLSILSRGVPALRFSIGRVLDGQLNHLISQSNGDINNPAFSNWRFEAENIAQFERRTLRLNPRHPRQANYAALDLTQLLEKSESKFGLFFVNVEGWDPRLNQRIYGVEDQRLILITDLGVIVKDSADGSHDLFVQSIKTGLPVNNATVKLLGKNGLPLYSRSTSNLGHVSFPSTRDFRHEKEPTVYLIETAEDLSFIPFNRYSRQINLSKFDIGGVGLNYGQRDTLNAYLFSDRGIYRPGETVNLGAIVKQFDFSNISGIPLEMVVRGPRNNEVKVSKITLPEFGFFDFQYQTQSTSDTGQYRASLHLVGDSRYRGREIGVSQFKVEEFQPDSLKIESQLLDVANVGWSDQPEIKVKVSLQNLFGIPAQDRDVKGRVVIEPTNFQFKAYSNYRFTDPFVDPKSPPLRMDRELAIVKTDADGIANFDIDLSQFNQGAYRLRFTGEGFEKGGGRSVTSTSSALISPLPELVGYKSDGKLDYILTDSKRRLDFIAIDKTLKQVAKTGLTFRLLQIQHVSTLIKQNNGTLQYQTVKKEKELSSDSLDIPATGYQYALDTRASGDFAIELLDNQNQRLSRVEYSIVGEGNLTGKLERNAELQVKLNQSDYLPGDLIEMNIQAPYAGAGLITIETDSVQQFKWFKTSGQSSMQSIRLPESLEGGGYVNVTFVRDFGSPEIFTSPLSYAVVPFSIDSSNRKVKIDLKVNDIVRPGKPMPITFQTSKPAKVAVFAIDEGILQVANYSTPDPLGHFLKKKALAVDTFQILDLILPEFNLLRALSASGGGADVNRALAKNLNPFARKTDQPAVFWSGIITTDSDPQTIDFNIPDTFSGSLRVMAVAVAEDAVGASQQSTLVRGPFVISPNVLTQAAPGDEFVVHAGIANLIEDSGNNAAVTISAETSEHLTIIGESSTQLKIDEGAEGAVEFKVRVNNLPGAAELKFKVQHGEEYASRTTSLSVRPAMPYYASFDSGYSTAKEQVLAVERKLIPALASQTLAASSSPLVLVDGLSAYLKTFPHGCTEQVVSQVFPLVGLMTHPAYAANRDAVSQQFAEVIRKLRERQLADGSFAFWPGAQSTAEYPSIYVMHFLIEAQAQGYPVPKDILQRGQRYLENYVAQPSTSIAQARNRATAIYLLSRQGQVTTNYLVDLETYLKKNYESRWHKDLLAAYIAATYKLLQKDTEAERLIRHYQLGDSHGQDLDEKSMGDFHSLLTRDSQYIYLLAKHFTEKAKALDGDEILKLTNPVFKGEYNTISAAYSILALGGYSKLIADFENETNQAQAAIQFSGLSDQISQALESVKGSTFPAATYPPSTEQLTIKAASPFYYLNTQSGFDQLLPSKAIRQGVEVQRDFIDADGNSVTTFEQGSELTVRLRIRSLENKILTNVALVDLLPGGFEVIRSSVSRTANRWRAEYLDIREDRVVFYGNIDQSVNELSYRVKLTAAGRFVVPPSFASSMYDRSIKGMSAATQFVVTPQDSQQASE